MKLKIGETYVLRERAVLWKEYPNRDVLSAGCSYETFQEGTKVTLVERAPYKDTFLVYAMDAKGQLYVVSEGYLSRRIL